jgi:hypothetical protein
MREAIQMGFVNEVASDEDIARYNLPFKPGAGRCWTRDKDRDAYLWGGIAESYAREYVPEGRFWFFLGGRLLDVSLNIDSYALRSLDQRPRVHWKCVSHVQPVDLGGLDKVEFFSVLKEALTEFGVDGEITLSSSRPIVTFMF